MAGAGLFNLVSIVPAVMLLAHLQGMTSGVTQARASTFAGNLLLVGSLANLIVVDLALKSGVTIDWRAHIRIGLQVTRLTLSLIRSWLSLI